MAALTMQRVFDAPPAKVFEFLTKTENLLNWWGRRVRRYATTIWTSQKSGRGRR